jgi:hypothetical protein
MRGKRNDSRRLRCASDIKIPTLLSLKPREKSGAPFSIPLLIPPHLRFAFKFIASFVHCLIAFGDFAGLEVGVAELPEEE